MKYRIIQRGDGKYQVQSKKGFFSEWIITSTFPHDYPDHADKESYNDWPSWKDFNEEAFSNQEWAVAKLDKLVFEVQLKKLKERFTVIKEVSV